MFDRKRTGGRPYFDSVKITVIFVGVDVLGDPFCANLNEPSLVREGGIVERCEHDDG